MSWVTIDPDKCTVCGTCVERCDRCFSEKDGRIEAEAGVENCILCGHCVALCPTDAITHQKMDMNAFVDISEQTRLESRAFIGFLKERRSHRHFLDKPISKGDLEILLDAGRYAPTGSNVQNTEILLYTDREKIKKVSDLTIDYFMWVEERVKRKLTRLEAEGKKDTDDYRFTQRTLGIGARMAGTKASGRDPLFYDAPCLMIFHSPSQTSTPKDNAVLIAHTIALTARTMGIETCYIGINEAASNFYPPLKEEYGIPETHQVYYSMIMGYPRLKFLKTVDRRPIRVQWK